MIKNFIFVFVIQENKKINIRKNLLNNIKIMEFEKIYLNNYNDINNKIFEEVINDYIQNFLFEVIKLKEKKIPIFEILIIVLGEIINNLID